VAWVPQTRLAEALVAENQNLSFAELKVELLSPLELNELFYSPHHDSDFAAALVLTILNI
jgi:hypothetical protein